MPPLPGDLDNQEAALKPSQVFVALALLTAAVLACSPASLAPTSLYKDSFSQDDSGWCVDSDTTSSSGYESDEYFFRVQEPNWFVWCTPDQKFEAIHVEAVAKNTSATDDTVFGVLCHYQNTDSFYYLGITSGGLYTIRLYINKEEQTLAEDSSDAITTGADSYKVGADCGNGSFVLYVDGQQVATAADATFASGDSGLFVWSGDNVPTEIRYDDFVVTDLNAATSVAPTP
jgi:hypothetical protein